jgi:hypothetical protein
VQRLQAFDIELASAARPVNILLRALLRRRGIKVMVKKIGLGILLAAVATTASASTTETCKIDWIFGFFPVKICTPERGGGPTPVAAPEIDPASAVAGLTLMAGGLAVLAGRRKKIIPA